MGIAYDIFVYTFILKKVLQKVTILVRPLSMAA
jgi:hypothetical protein